MKLKNKVAIVTGSGSGIGKGIALEYAKEGAKVVVNVARSIDSANEVVEEINKIGGEALAIKADVSKSQEVQMLISETIKHFGKIDILVNNAGITQPPYPLADIEEEDWYRMIDINLNSIFLMSKYAIPEILKSGEGSVINIASIASFEVGSGAGYVATKHAVLGLTKQMAFDYGRKGINCNAICPGAIESKMTSGMFDEGSQAAPLIKTTPAERLGKPEEIGKLAVYLASEDAKFVHGSAFVIDGGWLIK
ncbi:3-oxoacyl-[acyl-carrier-protein] reductase FabG [Gottschalkia acidurici 9a]|uniref:3-oxoacyl-[acyl-carrier-protein] reductase FabG n=1 Tax=Gottschalkia acidurici (strain ATCC 7906 / DSM 604 / BCRC 14475 / CIP 104303 / KCTC 5404 / NCIMB 10678 / 9a) TaxID=1128398 RepID=K0AYQ9_GOTA9|nr:glucose 1-dehydrogenase [Gottschalkia acidurici]AFS78903.1 3-oxoacyl-[acyl-carrier-protein] reductase FabG [Gottschalkia acidurici 9a]